jgi:hypothetical protein
MKRFDCPFESDTLAAAVQGRWPDRVDSELRAHILSCEICTDVAAVAGALDNARDDMRSHVVVPDSGRVWWLAQLRARREAARTAARPITAAQVIAFASVVALLGACFGATSTWFQASVHSLSTNVRDLDSQPLIPLLIEHGALAAAMLALLVLVPAVVYLTVSKE